MTVSPARARPGANITFKVRLLAAAAAGALAYRLDYGDGSSRENPVPQFCRAFHGVPEQAEWQLSHRYARAGAYQATAHGRVNCSSARVAVTVDVVIA